MRPLERITKLLKSKRFYEWLLLISTVTITFYIGYRGIENLRVALNKLNESNSTDLMPSVIAFSFYKNFIYISLILLSYHFIDKKLR